MESRGGVRPADSGLSRVSEDRFREEALVSTKSWGGELEPRLGLVWGRGDFRTIHIRQSCAIEQSLCGPCMAGITRMRVRGPRFQLKIGKPFSQHMQ